MPLGSNFDIKWPIYGMLKLRLYDTIFLICPGRINWIFRADQTSYNTLAFEGGQNRLLSLAGIYMPRSSLERLIDAF